MVSLKTNSYILVEVVKAMAATDSLEKPRKGVRSREGCREGCARMGTGKKKGRSRYLCPDTGDKKLTRVWNGGGEGGRNQLIDRWGRNCPGRRWGKKSPKALLKWYYARQMGC